MQLCEQVGAFSPRDPAVAQQLQDGQHAVPVLMVHGKSDTLVPLERRRECPNTDDWLMI